MVIIDALTQREWVREDYIPSHEGGIRDTQVLESRGYTLEGYTLDGARVGRCDRA